MEGNGTQTVVVYGYATVTQFLEPSFRRVSSTVYRTHSSNELQFASTCMVSSSEATNACVAWEAPLVLKCLPTSPLARSESN